MNKELLKRMLNTLGDIWERFWFTPISTSALAVFRILLGILLIQYALLLMPDLYVWFGKNGIVSSATINGWQSHIRLNILNLFPNSDQWLTMVYALLIIAAISLTLGLMTRLSAILVFICLSSLHARNPLILNSGDIFMRMLCFWLMFSPAGASLSIDSWLKATRMKHDNRASPPVGDIKASPWAQRLMQINMTLLYAQTFAQKIIGNDWQNGTALYFSSRMTDMHRFPVFYIFDHLWTCRLLSWSVLGIEFSLCTLVWIKPLKYYVLMIGILMHLIIDWTMNIPQFEWIMIVSYILFVEPADMDQFLYYSRQFLVKLMKRLHFSQTLV
jgi:hypothetical protein